MSDRIQYAESKVIRTKSWQSQPEFDNIISDLDVSSLCQLRNIYNKEIKNFPNNFDLNHPDHFHYYKEIQQKYKMVSEELNHRMMDIYASESYQDRKEFFNPNTGIVMDENYNILYSVAFTEDEDDIVYNHTNNSASFSSEIAEDDETAYEYYKPIDNKKAYAVWNYYEDLDEDR